MVFKDITVKSIDTKSQYFYSPRRIEIVTSEKRIITPYRSATLYEFNQKSSIPTDLPLDNDISISLKKLNKNKLTKFLKGNGLYASWAGELVDATDRMKYSPFQAHVIQPTISNVKIKHKDGSITEIESGVEFLRKNTKERERFLRFIIKMQTDAGLDIITIPFLNLPLTDYQALITDITKQLRKENREPMFVFDLQYQKRGDKFEDAMNFLIDKAKIQLVAFPNRSFESSPVSYDILSSFAEKGVAFLTFDVERTYRSGHAVSKMHSFPFIGSDIFAVKTPKYYPPSEEDGESVEEYTKTKESIKFFNPANLLVEPSEQRIKHIPKLLEEIDQQGNKWLKDILGDFDRIQTEQDRIYVMNAVSKVHELKSSTKEFDTVEKRIKSSESTEYIKEKAFLAQTLDKLKTKKRKK